MKVFLLILKTEFTFLFASLDSAFKILIFIVFHINMHIRQKRKGVIYLTTATSFSGVSAVCWVSHSFVQFLCKSVRPFSFYASYNINKPSAPHQSLTDVRHLTKLQF